MQAITKTIDPAQETPYVCIICKRLYSLHFRPLLVLHPLDFTPSGPIYKEIFKKKKLDLFVRKSHSSKI